MLFIFFNYTRSNLWNRWTTFKQWLIWSKATLSWFCNLSRWNFNISILSKSDILFALKNQQILFLISMINNKSFFVKMNKLKLIKRILLRFSKDDFMMYFNVNWLSQWIMMFSKGAWNYIIKTNRVLINLIF
jgi:hypothetical protein